MMDHLAHLLAGARKRTALVVAALLAATTVAGCSAPPEPVEIDVQTAQNLGYPDASLAELQGGFELYVAKCASCHDLRYPASKKTEQWSGVMSIMGERAKLDEADHALVQMYLEALSARPAEEDPFHDH